MIWNADQPQKKNPLEIGSCVLKSKQPLLKDLLTVHTFNRFIDVYIRSHFICIKNSLHIYLKGLSLRSVMNISYCFDN